MEYKTAIQALLMRRAGTGKKGIINNVLNIVLGIIALVGVALPITITTVNNVSPSTTGITTTVLSYLPVFVALGALAYVAFNFFKGD